MLRAKRSFVVENRERERRRALVLEAVHQKKEEEMGDQLLADIIASVPRTTPKLIDEVLDKVRRQDEHEADLLQAALDQSTMLKVNLDGMDPSQLWSEPVRDLWQETIHTLTAQTSRWKATPLVMIHPYYGKVAVCLSLCGKCRPQNEFERMRLFSRSLRDGFDHLVDSIHPVMDEKVGKSIPKEETREILLDVSQELNEKGELSEETEEEEECSEDDCEDEDNEDYRKFDKDVEIVTGDWTKDKPSPVKLTTTPSPSAPSSLPTLSPTPTQSSSFSSPLHGVESPDKSPTVTKVPTLTSGTSSPLTTRSHAGSAMKELKMMNIDNAHHGIRPRAQVSRTLFPVPSSERLVSFQPKTSSVIEEPSVSPILKPASESGIDLSKGYSVIPYQPEPKRRSPRKAKNSDAGKSRNKRPVSSPNYPAPKANSRSRREENMARTNQAVQLLQVQQANQNDVLARVAEQMNQLTYSLMEMNSRHQQ